MLQRTNTYIETWKKLEAVFEHNGYKLFSHDDEYNQRTLGFLSPSNYIYVPFTYPRVSAGFCRYAVMNGCQHAVEKDKRYYVARVLSVRGEGLNTLQIMRILSSQSPENLLSNHHILPMAHEFMYQDIVFGVFPLTGARVQTALLPVLAESTVEDIVYIVMQALEV